MIQTEHCQQIVFLEFQHCTS